MSNPRQTCACGVQAKLIRYVDGKKTCDTCRPVNRSGTFLRRLEGEVREYHRDVVQPLKKDGTINPDYIEVYGEKKLKKALNAHGKRRNA
jgi:hypothetical protein